MEDFQLDIVVGKGPAASSIRLTLPPFTLVGATTRTGMITGPLRDRFGLVARLDYYDTAELEAIVGRAGGILDVALDTDGAWEIARRSRGTPRIANRLLRRVRTMPRCAATGDRPVGRTRRAGRVRHRRSRAGQGRQAILGALCEQFRGGPVGCRRWRSPSASRPRRSRTCTSRSSSSRASSPARRVAASAMPAADEHLDSRRRAAHRTAASSIDGQPAGVFGEEGHRLGPGGLGRSFVVEHRGLVVVEGVAGRFDVDTRFALPSIAFASASTPSPGM